MINVAKHSCYVCMNFGCHIQRAVYPQHANNLSDHISFAYSWCQQFQGKERRCQSDKLQALEYCFPFLSPTPVSLRIHYYQSDP